MRYVNYILLLIASVVWLSALSNDNNLHIIACDVGQGDAILVTYKNYQILTDGGPNNQVLTCLGKYMPIYDRTIELVILTHPQADHYTGLIEVFKRYKVDNYLYNDIPSSNQGYQVLENMVGGSGTNVIRPQKGMVIGMGLIQLVILHPETDRLETNVNDVGIVTRLKYKEFEALFTADVENKISDELARLTEIKGLDYIKVNHHGSRNGMTDNLLKAVMPKIAVISLGKDNRYKHPHIEIISMLKNLNIQPLRTDELGDVEIITDGVTFWVD